MDVSQNFVFHISEGKVLGELEEKDEKEWFM